MSQRKISSFFSAGGNLSNTSKATSDSLRRSPRKCQSSANNSSSPEKKKARHVVHQADGSPKKSPVTISSTSATKLAFIEQQSSGVVTNFSANWLPVLEREFSKDYFQKLSTFVSAERKKSVIYPPAAEVFSWTRACNVKEVKVVILGQDPYHGPKQAHGLCFSVLPGVAVPPSLQNMYKELSTDIPGFKPPSHGYLMGWAKQGVLLLNAVLTVKQSNANSHKDQGWENVTDCVIKYLNDNYKNIVFILWGSYAQKKGACINKNKHHVLKGPHPSPLSAHRGFFGSKPFSKANTYLKSKDRREIDWSSLPC